MRRRLIASLALIGAMTAACGSGGSAGTDGTNDSSAARPAISADASNQVLADYVKRYNKAVGDGDAAAWRDLSTAALGAAAQAQLRIGGGRPPRRPTISLSNPVFYVPRLATPESWFAVAALEHDGTGNRPVFLLFTKVGSTWRAATRLYFHGDPPKIAVDAQGYAIPIDPNDSVNPGTTPAGLPAAQAGYMQFGGSRPIAAGRFTSQWRDSERRAQQEMRARGVSATDNFAASGYPVYALRTTEGGALVFYAIKRTEDIVLTGGTGPDALPDDIRGYLDGQAGDQILATWMWRIVAYLPATGNASVIFQSMDLTSARASP